MVLDGVGFSNYANIEVETPKGDFKLLIITGCLGSHLNYNSNKTSPTPGLIKQIEP